MSKRDKLIATDHLCRMCGTGTIVEIANGRPSAGGDPVFKCITCDVHCAKTTERICYCGWRGITGDFEHRCFRRSEPQTDVPREDGWHEYRLHYQLGVMARREILAERIGSSEPSEWGPGQP